MKQTLLIFTALMLVVGCSKTRNDGELIVKDGLTYDPDTKALYSGKVFNNYPDYHPDLPTGEKMKKVIRWYEGSYKDGKKMGLWTWYSVDGKMAKKVTYKGELKKIPPNLKKQQIIGTYEGSYGRTWEGNTVTFMRDMEKGKKGYFEYKLFDYLQYKWIEGWEYYICTVYSEKKAMFVLIPGNRYRGDRDFDGDDIAKTADTMGAGSIRIENGKVVCNISFGPVTGSITFRGTKQ
jgi:hypothetical protein